MLYIKTITTAKICLSHNKNNINNHNKHLIFILYFFYWQDTSINQLILSVGGHRIVIRISDIDIDIDIIRSYSYRIYQIV